MTDKNLEEELELLKLDMERLKKKKDEIPPHRHCLNCGIAIPPDKTFCSKKCENEWNAILKKKKMNMYIWMIFLIILIVIMFLAER